MGADDLFKKRRQERKQREHEYRNPKANSFLIVTEGERTEPLYFAEMQRQIKEKIGGAVEVVEVPVIDIHGEGCSTKKLIEATEQIVRTSRIFYQNIWVVFDKDEFKDFDEAIKKGKEKGFKIAWSNQSFEYWLYLHFHYSDSALHRDEWKQKLDQIFKEKRLGNGCYQKNYNDIYNMVNTEDGLSTAIKNAKRRMANFKGSKQKASEYDPGTTVHKLVEELKKYLDE